MVLMLRGRLRRKWVDLRTTHQHNILVSLSISEFVDLGRSPLQKVTAIERC